MLFRSQRSASSTHGGDKLHGVSGCGLTKLDSGDGWCAQSSKVGEYVAIDLLKATNVAGVVMQGRKHGNQYVKTVKFAVSTSDSATPGDDTFTSVGNGTIFDASKDRNTKVWVYFAKSISARHVRIYPQTWYGHMSMRAGLIVDSGNKPPLNPFHKCTDAATAAKAEQICTDMGARLCTSAEISQGALSLEGECAKLPFWTSTACAGSKVLVQRGNNAVGTQQCLDGTTADKAHTACCADSFKGTKGGRDGSAVKVSLSHPTIEKDSKKYAVTLSGTKVKAVTEFKADDTDAKAGVLSFTLADTPKGTYDLKDRRASCRERV